MKKMMNHNVYITHIHLREDDTSKIYVGDTEGSIHLIKPEVSNKADSTYMIEKSNYNYHRIHVMQILFVAKDNALFSIGNMNYIMARLRLKIARLRRVGLKNVLHFKKST